MPATCRHLMPSGLRCQSPAMRGGAFCYQHGRRIPPVGSGASTSETRIDIPAVLDDAGITHALTQVLQGLGNGGISPRRASILLYGLQMAHSQTASCNPPPARSGYDPLSDPAFDVIFDPALSEDQAIEMAESLLRKMNSESAGDQPSPSPQPHRTS